MEEQDFLPSAVVDAVPHAFCFRIRGDTNSMAVTPKVLKIKERYLRDGNQKNIVNEERRSNFQFLYVVLQAATRLSLDQQDFSTYVTRLGIFLQDSQIFQSQERALSTTVVDQAAISLVGIEDAGFGCIEFLLCPASTTLSHTAIKTSLAHLTLQSTYNST